MAINKKFLIIFSLIFVFSVLAGIVFADYYWPDQCPYSGAVQCYSGYALQTCGDYDNDGNLEWSVPEKCPPADYCDNNYSGCYYYGENYRLMRGLCQEGVCNSELWQCLPDWTCPADSCENECWEEGLGMCEGYGYNIIYKVCGDWDVDPCLEWKGTETCDIYDADCGYGECDDNEKPVNTGCLENSGCYYECEIDLTCCTNECSKTGNTTCVDAANKKTCGNYDYDYCLEWSSPQSCVGDTSCDYGTCTNKQKPNWYCSGGECLYTCVDDPSCCVNECSEGAVKCFDSKRIQTCGNYDPSDSCLEWSDPFFCSGSISCGYDFCDEDEKPSWYCDRGYCLFTCVYDSSCLSSSSCSNECSPSGQSQCVGSSYRKTCGNYNSDSCLEWSSLQSCLGNTSCDYGNCNSSQRPSNWRCLGGSCIYDCVYDSICAGGENGNGGNGGSACVNDCPTRWLTECVDAARKKVCGYNYIKDGCLHWYPPESCILSDACGYGECEINQKPVNWRCNILTNSCKYDCVEDSACLTTGYVKNYQKNCHDDDIYWFDLNGVLQDKFQECADDNPETADGCENSQCFNRLEEGSGEEDYCQSEEHCGDGICNCDEDIYTCFQDCEAANLKVSISVKRQSESDWQDSVSLNPKDKIDILLTVLNESKEDIDNLEIKVQLPQEIIYKGKLKVDEISLEGNIGDGVTLGSIFADTEKRVTFKAEVSSEAAVGAEPEIKATTQAGSLSGSDSLKVVIEKEKFSVFRWIISRWYIWLLLWVGFVAFLYWVLKRSSQ